MLTLESDVVMRQGSGVGVMSLNADVGTGVSVSAGVSVGTDVFVAVVVGADVRVGGDVSVAVAVPVSVGRAVAVIVLVDVGVTIKVCVETGVSLSNIAASVIRSSTCVIATSSEASLMELSDNVKNTIRATSKVRTIKRPPIIVLWYPFREGISMSPGVLIWSIIAFISRCTGLPRRTCAAVQYDRGFMLLGKSSSSGIAVESISTGRIFLS
jgi:hypothetical protein